MLGAAAKALGIWVVLLVLAVLNGTLRETVLIPALGVAPGWAVSGLLLASLILAVTYLMLPWLRVHNSSGLLLIGLSWLILTVSFEFSFGLLRGKTLVEILDAYTFKGGNLWLLVLVVTAAAPWLAARFRAWN